MTKYLDEKINLQREFIAERFDKDMPAACGTFATEAGNNPSVFVSIDTDAGRGTRLLVQGYDELAGVGRISIKGDIRLTEENVEALASFFSALVPE